MDAPVAPAFGYDGSDGVGNEKPTYESLDFRHIELSIFAGY